MLFIPQEVKEKIDSLEQENKHLLAENSRLADEASQSLSKQNKGAALWVVVALLAVAIAYIIYLQIQFNKQQVQIDTLRPETLEAVIMRDGQIEKWNAATQHDVVYRVQLGAYQDFDLSPYKQNLDGLRQDSIDGYNRVSLGAFSRLEDAQKFLVNMLDLELKNVFIVAYKNNDPIGLIEAKNQKITD